jgi:hypothetical protein
LKKLEQTLAHTANFFIKCETVEDTKKNIENQLGPDPLPTVAPWMRKGGIVSSEKFLYDGFSSSLEFNDMML